MYDLIVVGAGHAGIEAALAGARKNFKTLLITTHFESIGHLPCNPSIGGPAKGVVVKEIDALGGQMAQTTDQTYLQMKMLNTTKGPAVHSLRAQIDKIEYPKYMSKVLFEQENLELIEDSVVDLITRDKQIEGVITKSGEKYLTKKLVITSGTYLEACKLVSDIVSDEGPDGYDNIKGLSNVLKKLGISLQRLKTGTPARVATDTIDFSQAQIEYGSDEESAFNEYGIMHLPFKEQLPCFLTYTNLETHQIINDNLNRSSMYSGVVKGVGPRYCPSIEDKLVRFSDKDRHQIFLEPEAREMNSTYVQGFSTSMPYDVQDKMIRSIVGLENAKILKYGYAIEYDAIDSTQLKLSLESKLINGLYFAGQINGTSGYEEAAAQGLIAGINATLALENKKPLILKRDEAYIGVMIDDLVTKGTNEPYRLLTSRAEYRLLLRNDNAFQRLATKGYEVGLLSEDVYQKYLETERQKNELRELLDKTRFTPKSIINEGLNEIGSSSLYEGISASELMKRPEIKIDFILQYLDYEEYEKRVKKQVEIEIKYEGYIAKAIKQAQKFSELEEKLIPENIDYDNVTNLAIEARQKLSKIRPMSIGQATRISGINPSDIQNLLIYLKSGKL